MFMRSSAGWSMSMVKTLPFACSKRLTKNSKQSAQDGSSVIFGATCRRPGPLPDRLRPSVAPGVAPKSTGAAEEWALEIAERSGDATISGSMWIDGGLHEHRDTLDRFPRRCDAAGLGGVRRRTARCPYLVRVRRTPVADLDPQALGTAEVDDRRRYHDDPRGSPAHRPRCQGGAWGCAGAAHRRYSRPYRRRPRRLPLRRRSCRFHADQGGVPPRHREDP